MKVTLNQIVSSVDGLKALLDVKLPFKISYRISKLVNNKLESELKIYNELRNKLITDLGEKNEDGNYQVKDPKKLEEFTEKMQELLNQEVELDFEPLKVEDIGDAVIESKNVVPWIFE